MCDERNDEKMFNESNETKRNLETFIEDEIQNESTYDENYKQAVEEIIVNLNKKNKKNNRTKGMLVMGTFILAFSTGFLTNYFVNNKSNNNTTPVSYEMSSNNENNNSEGSESEKDKDPKEENDNSDKSNEKENLTVEEVAKKVSPAVVTISVSSQGNMFTPGTQGVGTGFIVDKDGTVVTNYHVIEGATSIVITFSNGTEVTGKIVATSKKDDLAILKIVEEVEMPGIAELSQNDEVNAGQEVVAIGNPLGKEYSGTVTRGIISSPSRKITMDGIEKEFIQTDAAINPGNSGGPLINLKGEIIGVNTAKQSGENVEGIGFAVAIKHVRNMLENLEQYTNENNQDQFNNNQGGEFNGGEYPNGGYPDNYPGYGYENPGSEYPNYRNPGYGEEYQNPQYNNVKLGVKVISTDIGLVIVEVESGSVAERAGMQLNDIISEFQGVKINSAEDLLEQLSLIQRGQSVETIIQRNGQNISIIVTF